MGGKKTVDRSKVLEFLKSSKGSVGKSEIVAATGFDGDFSWCMQSLMSEYDEIQKFGVSRNTTYIWNPKKAQYSEMKNPEGYPDGTAGKAIANVMKHSNNGKYPMRQHFGEVWSTSNVSDDMEGLLIISAKEGTCICYNVYPSKKNFMKENFTFKWVDNTGAHYISTINPVNITERKLGKKLYEIGTAEKDSLKDFVAAAIDVSPVIETTRTIEVPVEVIKEVPVEVIKPVEIHAEEREIEMAVLKAKCEIYERLIFDQKICKNISQEIQAV